MKTSTGKSRKTLAATTGQLLRIVQSISSKKAEPFKLWLARVSSQRLDQLQDPALSIEQAMRDYKRLGYSDNWINTEKKMTDCKIMLSHVMTQPDSPCSPTQKYRVTQLGQQLANTH